MASLFWDSNVFYAYLNNETDAYDIDSINQFINEASAKKHHIYTSSMVFAEVTPSRLNNNSFGTFQEFLDDFEGMVTTISADPNILTLAGNLKDLPFKKGKSTGRILTTGDATMLATAIELEDTYDVKIDHFHTFDDGKGKTGPEGGKGVSLLNFADWCEGIETHPLVKRVLELDRCPPIHPEKKLL